MLTSTSSGRGWHSHFFVKDPGLALAPKMCPDQSQTFKEVNNSQAFTVGRKKNVPLFSERAASRCSKAWLYRVSRKYSKNWLRRTSIRSNWTPKIDHTLQPRNYDAKPWFLHFTAQKSKCPRRFWEIDLGKLHTCPSRALDECFFFVFVFVFRWKCGIP